MAAPADMTTLDLTATFVLNKTLSTTKQMDDILKYQGVGWLLRTAISVATITIYVKHYKDESGVEHIDIKQVLTGGIEGTVEDRTLDWKPRTHDDSIFGAVIGKARRIAVESIGNEFLKRGWLPDTHEHGAIDAYAASDTEKTGKKWKAEQIWGFEDFNGERRYSRHVKFTGSNNEDVEAVMVYDYYGPNK